MSTVLEVNNLVVHYASERRPALRDVSFRCEAGERLAIIGSSGSGKSTLMKALNRLVPAQSGEILISGQALSQLSTRQLRQQRRRMAMIFQDYNLIQRKTVLENVLLGRLGHKSLFSLSLDLWSPQEQQLALRAIKEVGLEDKIFERADQLSGGQRQRVAIAKALCQEPEILLADEPCSALDPKSSERVISLFNQISKERQLCLLINLHDVRLACQFPRILALKDGQIHYDGSPDQLDQTFFDELYTDDEG